METDARHILRRWAASLNDNRLDDLAALYAEDCTLLPTLSAGTCRTRTEARAYFQSIMQEGLRVAVDEDSVMVTALGEGWQLLSGHYTFRGDTDDAAVVYPARFTFIINIEREHPILHHHSSQIARDIPGIP